MPIDPILRFVLWPTWRQPIADINRHCDIEKVGEDRLDLTRASGGNRLIVQRVMALPFHQVLFPADPKGQRATGHGHESCSRIMSAVLDFDRLAGARTDFSGARINDSA